MRDDDRISAHLDGELDELESVRFARDLSRDPALRDAVETLRAHRARLRHLADDAARAPAGFADRVMAGLDAQEGASEPTWSWRPFALAAAAALVLWAALPGHGIVPTDPAAAPAPRAPVSTDGSFYAVLAAQSYTLTPHVQAHDGAPGVAAAELRKRVEAAGGSWEGAGPTFSLVVPTGRWVEVQRVLGEVGTLTPNGGQVPFIGQVRVPVDLRP